MKHVKGADYSERDSVSELIVRCLSVWIQLTTGDVDPAETGYVDFVIVRKNNRQTVKDTKTN